MGAFYNFLIVEILSAPYILNTTIVENVELESPDFNNNLGPPTPQPPAGIGLSVVFRWRRVLVNSLALGKPAYNTLASL